MAGTVHSEIEAGICTITIENQGKRNAIDYSILEELIATFEALEERDEPTVVVLRGAGERAFSAGFDLDIDRTAQPPERDRLWPQMAETVVGYTYPVIGMANGDTYGGAMNLIACCDLRIGVEGARFAITPAKIGLVYGGRAINRIMQLIGPAKTKELLFTAEPIDTAHAVEIGLLNEAVDRDALESRTYEVAETIAANAPRSLRVMKEIVDAILEKQRLSAAETKWIREVRRQAFESDDHAEGVAAFREGREPEFQDR